MEESFTVSMKNVKNFFLLHASAFLLAIVILGVFPFINSFIDNTAISFFKDLYSCTYVPEGTQALRWRDFCSTGEATQSGFIFIVPYVFLQVWYWWIFLKEGKDDTVRATALIYSIAAALFFLIVFLPYLVMKPFVF